MHFGAQQTDREATCFICDEENNSIAGAILRSLRVRAVPYALSQELRHRRSKRDGDASLAVRSKRALIRDGLCGSRHILS